MINSAKFWYALSTKPGCEKKVSNMLTRKNIDNYCPLKRSEAGYRKTVLEPLFNSLVFIYTNEYQIPVLCKNDHIINVVYWLGKPAIIRSEEIEVMKGFLNEYANVNLQKMPFTLNGMTRTVGESITGQKTPMVSVKNNTVKIVLASLGYIIFAEVENSNVEVFKSATQSYSVLEKFNYAV